MPTTSRGYDYPVLGDAPNVPADMQALAESINTDVGNVSTALTELFVRRTADSSAVNNSTTLVSDSVLALTPAISTVYTLSGLIVYSSNIAADIKFGFTFPAGATLTWTGSGVVVTGGGGGGDLAANVALRLAADSTFAYAGGDAFIMGIPIRGTLIMGSTAGNLTARWAQNSAHASNTNVRQDSWLSLLKRS